MQLSPQDIAAAEVCGVSFIPASPAQVQRLAMQRKIFYRAGEAILATRGNGFYETVGTLQRLIEEGLRQQRDLAEWLQPDAPPQAPVPDSPSDNVPHGTATAPGVPPELPAPPSLVPEAEPDPKPMVATVLPEPVEDTELPPAAPVQTPAKRPRRDRRAPAVAPPWPGMMAESAPASDPLQTLPETPEVDASPPVRDEAPASRLADAAERVEQRGGRWLVAGAIRRGRAGKHWSTRQR